MSRSSIERSHREPPTRAPQRWLRRTIAAALAATAITFSLSLGATPALAGGDCGLADDGEVITWGGRHFRCDGLRELWLPI